MVKAQRAGQPESGQLGTGQPNSSSSCPGPTNTVPTCPAPANSVRAKPEVDYRLYVITSGSGRSTVDTAASAARAGAGIIQVREKTLGTAALLDLTQHVADAVSAANPRCVVVVDDRADVAFAAARNGHAVHGVHLGQDDLPVDAARELLGPHAIIGLTTGTLDLVRDARRWFGVIDYVGAGPFRLTPTKDSGRVPLGVAGYRPLVEASAIPVVAIGDITVSDVSDLVATGVAGVAMVRAIMNAPDPQALAHEVLHEFAEGQELWRKAQGPEHTA